MYGAIFWFQAVSSPHLGSTRLPSLSGDVAVISRHIVWICTKYWALSSRKLNKIIVLPSIISIKHHASSNIPYDASVRVRPSRHIKITIILNSYQLVETSKTIHTDHNIQLIGGYQDTSSPPIAPIVLIRPRPFYIRSLWLKKSSWLSLYPLLLLLERSYWNISV